MTSLVDRHAAAESLGAVWFQQGKSGMKIGEAEAAAFPARPLACFPNEPLDVGPAQTGSLQRQGAQDGVLGSFG
ncbi:hypothetical protein RFM68_21150 [Mesorhizobium sp. MSK_1335]|uniref:Uncharacterized protein n=1 Tax=Mesorhizobium montanum TaxID=3072323 RepID=A0ABU4ZNQ8_9HYPH|nr:hypothetical protein [Mesorhizobium sp. MSK_1335]MDX8527012.1 hypothetical protein [Mesorhizobium sp. MSK_1335]